jgi:predicted deacylase
MTSRRRAPCRIADTTVEAGSWKRIDVPVARLPTGTWLHLPIAVAHGAKRGRRVWLSAGIHGDELNGIEIIRRVLPHVHPEELTGTLVALPTVNVFGLLQQTRYLPDRRDLNRSFPGSATGSLAARLAHFLMQHVVTGSDLGIDLHTGSQGRRNLPQIRADLSDAETLRLARAFHAPALVHSRTRDGSLREAAASAGVPVLLFEGGEALRFDEDVIERGVDGVLRVLRALRLGRFGKRRKVPPAFEGARSGWTRAGRGGICRLKARLGDHVNLRQEIAVVADAFGDGARPVRAQRDGLVIGINTNPLVNRGDAIVHIAERASTAEPGS